MSVDRIGRILRSEPAREILALDTGDYTMMVSVALQADYGEGRHAIKRIARAANSNTRSAKNWLYGVNAPDGLHLLRLMADSPTLAAEVRRLTAMQATMDPRFERALSDAFRLWQQQVRGS